MGIALVLDPGKTAAATANGDLSHTFDYRDSKNQCCICVYTDASLTEAVEAPSWCSSIIDDVRVTTCQLGLWSDGSKLHHWLLISAMIWQSGCSDFLGQNLPGPKTSKTKKQWHQSVVSCFLLLLISQNVHSKPCWVLCYVYIKRMSLFQLSRGIEVRVIRKKSSLCSSFLFHAHRLTVCCI